MGKVINLDEIGVFFCLFINLFSVYLITVSKIDLRSMRTASDFEFPQLKLDICCKF
jgi:hypothetical protein